jgi:hypothetical protein
MPQKMPVVRQLHWISLIPQLVAIAALTLPIYVVIPRLGFFRASAIAALAYLIFCRLMRSWYERVLNEDPDCKLAQASLTMLRSGIGAA